MDISKDEIPTDKSFVTAKMMSDVNLSQAVISSSYLREYSGDYDIVTKLRGKTYLTFPTARAVVENAE